MPNQRGTCRPCSKNRVRSFGTLRSDGHELRSLHVQSWRLVLYKSHNIACTQTRERDASVFEKTVDERNVADDCRAGQRARVQQVLPEGLGTTLSRRRLAYGSLLAGGSPT